MNDKKSFLLIGNGGGGGSQVQADWNQSDNTQPDYIKNKPTVYNEWFGTQAEYDLIDPKDPNVIYHIEGSETVDWDDVENKPTFATVATSGDYTDLSNTPTIPAAPVQSDWNEADSGSLAYIANKPTIPAAQVNSDWNAVSGVAEILNKPTIPVVPPMTTETLTFTLSDQSTVTLTVYVQPVLNYFYVEDASGSDNTLSINQADGQLANQFEVFKSTDQINWTSMGTTNPSTPLTATVPANSKLYLKATNNGWGDNTGHRNQLNCSADFNVGGNLMSLVAGDNYEGATLDTNYTHQFYWMMNQSNVVDASNLVLPSNTTADCYNGMFWYCASMTDAPDLPATVAANNCYKQMFEGCTSLTTSPTMSATTIGEQSCLAMFRDCTALTDTPTFIATQLDGQSYFAMFERCSSLATVAALPNATWNSYDSPYSYMFTTCPLVDSITTYFTGDYTNYLDGWLTDVAQNGDFYNLGGATFATGASGIPTGWTEHNSI